jgi:hypothetical protein
MAANLQVAPTSGARIAAMHEPYKQPVNDWVKAPSMKKDDGYGFSWRDIKDHRFRWRGRPHSEP